MFYGCKHVLFSMLFAIVFIEFIQMQVNADDDKAKNVKKKIKLVKMDDLTQLNNVYYCKFQAVDHRCANRRTSRKYYFDIKLQRCRQFEYGFCDHSYNMFDGRRPCMDACRDEGHIRITGNNTANVYCMFQPDFGECNSYHPSFYYDISDRKCKGFAYSGCGGNANRFATANQCADECGGSVKLTSVNSQIQT